MNRSLMMPPRRTPLPPECWRSQVRGTTAASGRDHLIGWPFASGFLADMAPREGRVPPELWMGPCTYAQDRPEWVSDQSESDLSKPINPDASGDQ